MSTLQHSFDAGGGRSPQFFIRKDESVLISFSNYVPDSGNAGIKFSVAQVGAPFVPVAVVSAADLSGDPTVAYVNRTGFDVLARVSTEPDWNDAVDVTFTGQSDLVPDLADRFIRPDGSPFMLVFDDHVEFPETPKSQGEDLGAGVDAYTKAEVDAILAGYYTSAQVDTLLTGYLAVTDIADALESFNVVIEDDVQTLTNKRITARVTSQSNVAQPAINTDATDYFLLDAQAQDVTSFSLGLTGTPTPGQKLIVEIRPTVTVNIVWGNSFQAGAAALPVAVDDASSAATFVEFLWDPAVGRWSCMSVGIPSFVAVAELTLSLASFDGLDAQTTTTDDVAGVTHTLTNAELDTAQVHFGSASLTFNAVNGNDLVQGFSLDGTQDWTLEGFCNANDDIVSRVRVRDGSAVSQIQFTRNDDASQIQVTLANTGGSIWSQAVTSTSLPGGLPWLAWRHWAIVKEGTTYSLYWNGSQVATTTSGLNVETLVDMVIDCTVLTAAWYDEVRLSQTARYSGATYTIPPSPFSLD